MRSAYLANVRGVVVEVGKDHNFVKVPLLVAVHDTWRRVLQDALHSHHWLSARALSMVLDYLYRRKQLCRWIQPPLLWVTEVDDSGARRIEGRVE